MFTFKTTKPTGKYRSFYNEFHDIKIKGIAVGSIDSRPPHKIRLMVKKVDIMEDGNPNCPWKRIVLKKDSASLDEAKSFLNENFKTIMEKYPIWMEE